MTTTTPVKSWTELHRGPYAFYVVRPGAKPGKPNGQWLKATTTADDVESEALALLTDPRDAILFVEVWSVRDQQFVFTYRSERRAS